EIGNELLGIKSIANRPPLLPERTHRRDISRDLAWLAHGLWIVAGENQLGLRKLLKTEAHPVRAQFGGAVGPGPAGNVVIQPMLQVILERLPRASAMAGEVCGAPALARLKAANAAEIAADAAGKVRELDLQAGQFVEQAGIDQADRRRHQGKFPTQDASEIVGIHTRPADNARQRMNKDVEAEISAGFPERPQFLRIERQVLQFRSNHGARKSELDRAVL